MKRLTTITFVFVFIFTIILTVPVFAKMPIQESSKEKFTEVIKNFGYKCYKCTGGYFIGINQGAFVFRIYCDKQYIYKVIIWPDDIVVVTPW